LPVSHGQRRHDLHLEEFPCLSGNFCREENELFHTSRTLTDQIKNINHLSKTPTIKFDKEEFVHETSNEETIQ
jgi:hypothetical protein